MKKIWIRYGGISLGFILITWLFDSIVDYYFFYDRRNFPEILLLNIPPQELYFRLFIAVAFILFTLLFVRLIGKLKVAEEESRKREQRYRMIAEHTNDVIWTMDLNGNFTFISPSVKKLRGYEPKELLDKSYKTALTPASLEITEGLIKHFRQLLNAEPCKYPSVVTELEQPRKDGSTVWTEASVSTISGKDGKPSFILGVSRDISERKKREHELRQSEENYRLLAETTLDFILVHDTDGYITYVNHAALEASGYSMDDLVGKRIYDIVPEKEHDRVMEFAGKRDKGDYGRFLFEMDFLNAAGELVPLEVSSAPILLNKKPAAVLISARDITERRKSQRILEESERKFRSYIENSPLPLFVISGKDGKIQYTNDAAAGFLNFSSKEELIHKDYLTLKPGNEKDSTLESLARLLEEGTYQTESCFLNKKGEEVNALVKSAIIDNDNYLVYAVDISQRIHAEKKIREKNREIRRLNTGLEDIVKKRTAELSEANKELESFSYSVSHDLRAPLRHITAFSRLLKPQVNKSNPKAVSYLDTILASVEKMNTLIEDLLTFSRVGKGELQKADFDMNDLVKQVIKESSYEYAGRNVKWEIKNMGTVKADRKLIRLVWSNLISNAMKFTRHNELTQVEIGKNGGNEFYIMDNGVGFDPRYKAKLFYVFQRLHTESEFEGTGIGLANVKRIIDRHGGYVFADGDLKKGARFSFTLP